MAHAYGNGNAAPQTTVGPQFNEWSYNRAAIIEEKRVAYLQQLSNVMVQPKHMGKKIKTYRYYPILDDRNVNDQGIDAAGAVGALSNNPDGNLYASSRDLASIQTRLPSLGEFGGRFNRIGMTRVEVESQLAKFGVFLEYTDESMQFDTDAELKMHMYRELGRLKGELVEDMLMIDLFNSAQVVRFGGAATNDGTVTGEGATPSVISYAGIRSITKELNFNRCPINTKIISGSRNVDTRVIPAARYAYASDSLRIQLEDLTDQFGNPAWVPVEAYAAAGNIAMGEVGKVEKLRIIEHLELGYLGGKGAPVTDPATVYSHGDTGTGDRYDVHGLLVVGGGSFTTVGFQSNGKSVKFVVHERKPNEGMATIEDPYLERGIYSMKFYYGFLALRPDHIALYKCVCPM